MPWPWRLAALLLLPVAWGFAIVGYVPEYRFASLDWDGVLPAATHIVLFSVEVHSDGRLKDVDRLWPIFSKTSALRAAMEKLPPETPRAKLIVSVGGGGRSQGYPIMAASKKARVRFAKQVANLLKENPILAGVDLDWETPFEESQWRDMAKTARELRAALSQDAVMSMTYHPMVNDNERTFSKILSSKTQTSFVEIFDMVHCMAYDAREKRHSTRRFSKEAIDAWTSHNLPVGRMTLGLPFYGRHLQTSAPATYGEILDGEPDLRQRLEVDETKSGVHFNNGRTLKKKVHYAMRQGLAGVMIWELGQDKPISDPSSGSLLGYVVEAVKSGPKPTTRQSEGAGHDSEL